MGIFSLQTIISAILLALAARHGAVAQVDFQTCSFQDTLSLSGGCGNGTLKYYAPVSEVSACVSSFQLDPNNVTQYLESMIDMTRSYYVFTDIAFDPLASVSSVTPLNYPIYNGTGFGQVDVLGEMRGLMEAVQMNGTATLDVFLKVNEIYAKLFDRHVSMHEGLQSGGMLDDQTVLLYPSEYFGTASSVQWKVAFPTQDDEFVLLAEITDVNETSETKRVVQVDGKDTLTFLSDLALMPMGVNAFKVIPIAIKKQPELVDLYLCSTLIPPCIPL